MKEIKLPNYSWFYSNQQGKYVTNSFSGSTGTSDSNGCFCNATFNYRVYIKSDPEGESFIQAEYFYILPIKDGGGRTELISKKFENSEDGLIHASEWLSKQEEKEEY